MILAFSKSGLCNSRGGTGKMEGAEKERGNEHLYVKEHSQALRFFHEWVLL